MRDQLIEILEGAGKMIQFPGTLANILIENGVTIQKWIPVTERLPEHDEVVLVFGKRGGIYTAYCNRRHGYTGWHKLNSKHHYCEPTHWMPLPEPPKEVE